MLRRQIMARERDPNKYFLKWCKRCKAETQHRKSGRHCADCAVRRATASRRGGGASWAHDILGKARDRAKKAGVPFTLTKDTLPPLTTHCPVFGFEFSRGGFSNDRSPTLDRIVPELGYVPDNVVLVSDLANRMKSTGTVAQMYAVADFYYRLHQERGIPCDTPLRPLRSPS